MTKTWKRMAVFAVLALFIMSIMPAAFAERNTERGSSDRGEQIRMKKDALVERAEQIQENLQEKKEMYQEAFKEKKEQYMEARQAFLDKKEKLSELRQQVRECTEDSEDCTMKKLGLKRGVKEHLVKTIELIDRSLAKLRERVEHSKVLTDEERQDALDRITVLEERLAAKKVELEALADTVTNAEMRTQIKELKDLWHQVRKEQRWIVAQLTNAKQDNLVGIYVRYGDRAEAQIAKLTEQGADVTALSELLAKYRESVEELKVAQGEAKVAWMEAKSSPEALEHARELQQIFREKASETKASLRNLLQEIKEVRSQLSGEDAGEETTEATESPAETSETPAESTATAETPAEGAEPVPAETAETTEPATAE